jgi:outer membrane murein-binding lipoprotein Lpp
MSNLEILSALEADLSHQVDATEAAMTAAQAAHAAAKAALDNFKAKRIELEVGPNLLLEAEQRRVS